MLQAAAAGVEALGIDASPAMIDVATRRAAQAPPDIGRRVAFRHLPLEQLDRLEAPPFDVVLSNFSALNCLPSLAPLAAPLHRLVQPGGRLVLVVFGTFCPWETLGNLLRGRPATAFRRFRRSVPWRDGRVTVRYAGVHELLGELGPGFRLVGARGIGRFVPPSDFEPVARRFPRLLGAAAAVDRRMATILPEVGDHLLLELELPDGTSPPPRPAGA